MLPPDWKGRGIDFSFQLETVLLAVTLTKALSLSSQASACVCSTRCCSTSPEYFFFLYFFSVASHLTWPWALTLSKPSRTSLCHPGKQWALRQRHWLLAGWQIPGRTCSWEGTGAAWPVFPGLRIDLALANEEHMVLILRWGDLCQELCLFLSPDFIYKMKIPGRHKYSEKDNGRTVVSDPWKEALIALG